MSVSQEDIDRMYAELDAECERTRREYLEHREREMLRSIFLRLAVEFVLCGLAVYGIGLILRAVLS